MMSVEKENMYQIDKGQLRKLALSKRNSVDEACRISASEKTAERLLALDVVKKARLIMCYRSFRSEFPTDGIIAALENCGKKLCYPVCGKQGIMQAWHPVDKDGWKPGMMGLCEPDVEKSELIAPEDIDLVICPMVGFDVKRRRLGYGGGYYDRYLPQCKKAFVFGIAFEAQRMDEVACDEHDISMDLIITEEKIY